MEILFSFLPQFSRRYLPSWSVKPSLQAMTVFSELCGPTDVGVTEMKYKILEQKYLELLEKGFF